MLQVTRFSEATNSRAATLHRNQNSKNMKNGRLFSAEPEVTEQDCLGLEHWTHLRTLGEQKNLLVTKANKDAQMRVNEGEKLCENEVLAAQYGTDSGTKASHQKKVRWGRKPFRLEVRTENKRLNMFL